MINKLTLTLFILLALTTAACAPAVGTATPLPYPTLPPAATDAPVLPPRFHRLKPSTGWRWSCSTRASWMGN